MNGRGESAGGKIPLVTIGMPLYNEARFLAPALDALLAQDFPNFELVLSDNASWDRTQEICLAYAASDPRIRYFRKAANSGAVENFNTVFRAASGKYFLWASGHDLWDQSYISRCVELLERDRRVVLCATHLHVIGLDGELLETITDGIETRGLDAFERFRATLWGLARIPYSDPIYGLCRTEALRGTGVFRNVWGTDNLILLELSLAGPFAQIRDPLYCRRETRDRRADVETWTERYLEALSPRNRNQRWQLSYTRMCFGYAAIVHRSAFGFWQKARLEGEIWSSVFGKFWRGVLFHDVICSMLRLLFGCQATRYFKKHVYRMARSVGAYR